MIDLRPLPMEEARQFWAGKVILGPGEFAQLSAEAKVRAFAVSGIARGDELSTVFAALQKAINQGTGFDRFKEEAAEILQRRGWTGRRAWRIDNIFRTNIQTAYSVGRYQQMMEVADARPYWQYSAVNDSRTRPTHAAMDRKVFRHDHPFWDSWYPPNGFRCRCGVITLSEDDVREHGLEIEERDPTGKLIEPVDPLTGRKLPARLMMPDHGFKNHPGKAAWGGLAEADGRPAKWLPLPGLKGPADYRRPKLANVRPAQLADLDEAALLAAGQSDDYYRQAFMALYGEETVLTDATSEPVILSLRSFMADKETGSWKFAKGGHGEIIPLLRGMVEQPFEIWLTPQKNEAGQVRLTRRYISLWKTPDKKRVGGLAVFEVVDGVFQGVTAFAPLRKGKPDLRYLEAQRSGLLLTKGR